MDGELPYDNQITNAQDNFRINTFNVIHDQVTNSWNERLTPHEEWFKSIGIIDSSNFLAIAKLSHLKIANNLSYLVKVLKNVDANITVGTLTDELKDMMKKKKRTLLLIIPKLMRLSVSQQTVQQSLFVKTILFAAFYY